MPYYSKTGHCKVVGLLKRDRAVRGRVMQRQQSAVPQTAPLPQAITGHARRFRVYLGNVWIPC